MKIKISTKIVTSTKIFQIQCLKTRTIMINFKERTLIMRKMIFKTKFNSFQNRMEKQFNNQKDLSKKTYGWIIYHKVIN